MRVLVVSQYFWPEVFRINAVVRTLVERGNEVDVLTGKPNYPDGRIFNGYRAFGLQSEIWSGAKVLRTPLFPRGQSSSWRLALNYFSFFIGALLIGPWLLRGRKYDVIFVYGPSPILVAIPAIFLSWLKHCPMVLWVQDLWPDSLAATGYVRSRTLIGMVRPVVRWIYRHTDLLLVQSRAFEAPIAELAPDKKIVYYPNSVDPIFFEPPSATVVPPTVEALDEGFPVVFAGNIGTGQAVEVIVEAASLLRNEPQIRIVVFGQGSRWEWMRQQVKERALTNLHLPGRFPENTMPGLMKKASALLVTLADEPIFAMTVPNKIQAYLAIGRPILASLNGEGARLVDEAGAGLSVPAQDPRALADAILQLYAMPEARRAEMGANGRLYYKAWFDHERLVAQLQGYLQDVSVNEGRRS